MGKLTVLLAFHNHQPDGNFDHVFKIGYDDCYRPLLDLIGEFPSLRLSLHHTGPLLEWLDAHRPAYLDDLRALVTRGQVEVLGGGFYEPMLSVLPDDDVQGQLELMNQFCEARLGARPRGMWLAERVWEPGLPERIARAGLGYTLLDDTHFRYAGIADDLYGYYVTEKAGTPLALFPIQKELRYAIPFKQVHETVETLETLLARAGGRDVVCTYGDDGEKFGMWPHTKEWVWEKGWLRGFFQALVDNAERFPTSTFSDVLAQTPASGRVYLPTASYEEMGEWALPAESQVRYGEIKHRLEEEGRFEELRPYFRGGVWQSFMAKYPEANTMHKKMVYVSRKLGAAEATLPPARKGELAAARKELYRAQCNCAYWHGLFGGVYLNYLRHAVYGHLIGADVAADEVLGRLDGARAERADVDADLRDEVVLSSRELWVGVKPDAGGAFFGLDVRGKRFNLANVMGRRREGYHAKLREASARAASGATGGDGPKSIHDLAEVKEAGLEELLHYDRHPRLGFIDHLYGPEVTLDDFARGDADDRADLATGVYEIAGLRDGAEAAVELTRRGLVRDADGRTWPLVVDKQLVLAGNKLTCRWRLRLERAEASIQLQFAPELSLTLLTGSDPSRRFVVDGRSPTGDAQLLGSRGVFPHATKVELLDEWSRIRVGLEPGTPADFWRFPLETASQSEGGFERTYQGTVIAPVWPVELVPGQVIERTLALTVGEV